VTNSISGGWVFGTVKIPPDLFTEEPPAEPPPDDLVRSIEAELGRRLPAAYFELARRHNGGRIARTAHPSPSRTTWAEDHVAVTEIAAIGRKRGSRVKGPRSGSRSDAAGALEA
jgi:hypothetical protein